MAPERLILCGPLADAERPGDPGPVRLRMWGPEAEVHLRAEDVREALYTDVPPALLDLIDVAAYVYAADQAVVRNADGGEYGPGWRRNLAFRVPVREPDRWRSEPVRSRLVAALSFLSDDEYRFEFEPLAGGPPLHGYLDFGGTPFDGIVEDVVMFSGGLDSLAGAVREAVTDRRKVLLVHHRSSEKLTPRHRRLLDGLGRHAGAAAPLHLPIRVNKAERLSRETTQRSRSFLYTALGATFAVMLGRDKLRFYENGVMSLNLPPATQVVGGRATRTTHPLALRRMSDLLAALTGRPFAVENPFLWKTKTEVVRLAADAGCADLIGLTTSCAHTRAGTADQPHCGECSQCVDRRFAVLAAGQGDHDPASGYRVDLLTGERPNELSRAFLTAYLETANQVERMSPVDFFVRFGEAARALRQAGLPEDAAGSRMYDLYRRHAAAVNGVVDRAVEAAGRGGAIRRRELPPTCLIRLVSDGGPDAEPPAEPAGGQPADNLFQRVGQAWRVRFAGGREHVLLPSRGAAYLHLLLSRPDAGVPAAELAFEVTRNRARYALGDAGERIDRDAASVYRARCVDLRADLDRAERDNDPGAADRARAELEALGEELRVAAGLGGRVRKAADDRERVRKAVGEAVRRAIKDIREFDPALADHLAGRVRCGRELRYTADQGVRWET
ncbi:MAG: 7-cyano-7-deazaguanine synthase [Gemmataceae bacterium]|nr:7-cyano-7-deazaguanine synthase [Gemmataceae bacterium]